MSEQSPRWVLLFAEPGRIRSEVVVEGATLPLPAPADRSEIRHRGGRLELSVSGTDRAVLLNDVQVTGEAELRSGDQLRSGEALVLVQAHGVGGSPGRSFRWSPAQFEQRLALELARARHTALRFAFFLLYGPRGGEILREEELSPRLVETAEWTAWGERMFAVRVDTTMAGAQRQQLAALCGELPDARLAQVDVPAEARDAEVLWSLALARIDHDEPRSGEAVLLDPAMVRLVALLERCAAEDAALNLWGESSVGRSFWARHVHQRSGRRSAQLRVFDADEDKGTAALLRDPWPSDGTVLVRRFELLPSEAQDTLRQRASSGGAQLIATSVSPLEGFALQLSIPPLRERPSEIMPLALQAVQLARTWTGRSNLTLNAEARAALQVYRWPGNVQELRNAVLRAALVAESDELRLENLPSALQEEGGRSRRRDREHTLRSSMKAAEKDALLRALARTSWNVTAAAKELGMPRRTIVYRMARLGLRRPGR